MDSERIPTLIALGRDDDSVRRIRERAKRIMQENGHGYTLRLACAATLSAFLNEARINVPITLGAGKLAGRIRDRGWDRIKVGHQIPGDVGVTFDNDKSRPGADHVYLVVERFDDDLMIIADNQGVGKHRRRASGRRSGYGADEGAKTPTEYFLRASGYQPENLLPLDDGASDRDVVWDDEDTNGLPEPFNDDGTPASQE